MTMNVIYGPKLTVSHYMDKTILTKHRLCPSMTGLAIIWINALGVKAISRWTGKAKWPFDHWTHWRAWPRPTGNPSTHQPSSTTVNSDSGSHIVQGNACVWRQDKWTNCGCSWVQDGWLKPLSALCIPLPLSQSLLLLWTSQRVISWLLKVSTNFNHNTYHKML